MWILVKDGHSYFDDRDDEAFLNILRMVRDVKNVSLMKSIAQNPFFYSGVV